MKGPHGLNEIRLYDPQPATYLVKPFWIESDTPMGAEGLVFRNIWVNDNGRDVIVLAHATLVHVEGDDETRDAALAWLLDLCNLRYGGGG